VLAYIFSPTVETHVMPKHTEFLDDPLLRRRSSTPFQGGTKKRGKAARAGAIKWGWDNPVQSKVRSSANRDRPVEDAKEKAACARLAAMVAPSPLPPSSMPTALSETTFTEDDPRACPRQMAEFRLAVALELDRLRIDKKNYNL